MPTERQEGEIEFRALYSLAIATYFDVQVGARFDVAYNRADTQTRSFGVIGVQGLAPYFLEVDASLFVSTEGDVSAEFEAEYDLPITQRLIGQPRIGT